MKRASAGTNNKRLREASIELLFSEVLSVARRGGAALIVMNIPGPLREAPPALRELLLALEANDEVIFLDLSKVIREYLENHSPGSLEVHANDRHPSAAAHQLVAAELRRVITDEDLLGRAH